MAETNRSFFSGMTGRIVGSVAVLGLLAALMLTGPRQDSPGEKNEEEENNNPVETSFDRRCDQELTRIFDGMMPGRLGISSDPTDIARELNRWFDRCGEEYLALQQANDLETLSRYLDEDALARVETDRFLPEDVEHVRMSMLAKEIKDQVTGDAGSDVARSVALFEFVTRYIDLVPDDTVTAELPESPYYALLFRYGTAKVRAWTFATLLRQLRLDTVIITPQKANDSGQWLIGVIVPGTGVYLFDPHLGLPIPGADGEMSTPFPQLPATLSEVRQNDKLLRQFDHEQYPYPLSNEDLDDVKIELIGRPTLWSNRLAVLQWLIVQSNVTVDLYDGFGPNEIRDPPLLDRVANVGKEDDQWAADSISVWNYPLEQLHNFEEIRDNDQTQLAALTQVFAGPQIPQASNRTGMIEVKNVDFPLHAVRIEQLKGEHTQALRHMGPILSSTRLNQSQANQLAADFAEVWTGVSQFELKKYPAAVSTLRRYLNDHPPGTIRTQSAMDWMILSFLAVGELEQAAKLLEGRPLGVAPVRNVYLHDRWLNRLKKPAQETELQEQDQEEETVQPDSDDSPGSSSDTVQSTEDQESDEGDASSSEETQPGEDNKEEQPADE